MLSNYDKSRFEELGQDLESFLQLVDAEDAEEVRDILLGQSPELGKMFNTGPSGKHDVDISAWKRR